MRLGITGTYSSGKTYTSIVASHYFGIPRTRAKTMREILPYIAPGKALEDCTAAQLIAMIVTRHSERVQHETSLQNNFISDGCSLQEWVYGYLRVKYGINPNETVDFSESDKVELTPETKFFDEVMQNIGKHFLDWVKTNYDIFIHLENELPLSEDGHRPVNENFRNQADFDLQRHIMTLGIPLHIIQGSIRDRLTKIQEIIGIEPVISIEEAINLADSEYLQIDTRNEIER